MDVLTVAADRLGVTPMALGAALGRGESIASLAAASGRDVDTVTAAVVDSETSDIQALGTIAGFDDADVTTFVDEVSEWLRAYVERGEQAVATVTEPGELALG